MMIVDRKLISHVAATARLNLSEEEITEFLPQLKEILGAFSQIQEADTDGIEPSYHPVKIANAVREDKPEKCLPNDEALKNTQHKKDGYFKGPRIL